MSKTLNKYITALEYADKALFVLSGVGSNVSLCSFTTPMGIPGGIETNKNKQTNKHRKIVLLARSKLINLKTLKITSKVLIDSNICHEEFTVVINEEQSYY